MGRTDLELMSLICCRRRELCTCQRGELRAHKFYSRHPVRGMTEGTNTHDIASDLTTANEVTCADAISSQMI